MRNLLLAFVCLLEFYNLQAQCIADAGQDTTICVDNGVGAVFFGGSQTVIGGTPPYTYKWETSYTTGSNTYYASTFLNDTTLSNPQLTNFAQDSLMFYLTVTDSLGNNCRDSVVIRFCQFVMTLEDKRAYINQGDTVQLYHSVVSNCSPLQIQWFPNYNISNANIETPIVWPDTTTFYSAIITDSNDCIAIDLFKVFVSPVSVHEFSRDNIFQIVPNPTSGVFNIIFNETSIKQVRIMNSVGQIIFEAQSQENKLKVDLTSFPSGIYFLSSLKNDNSVVIKLIKE